MKMDHREWAYGLAYQGRCQEQGCNLAYRRQGQDPELLLLCQGHAKNSVF